MAPILTSNIRLGWKWLAVANTIAYTSKKVIFYRFIESKIVASAQSYKTFYGRNLQMLVIS
jgi:hypothetical protein